MSRSDDDQDMRAELEDRLVAGAAVPSEPGLTAFVASLRATAAEPAPAPSAELAALLRGETARPALHVVGSPTSRRRAPLRVAAGLGLAAKLALGAGAAAAATVGAATIDAVPDAVQVPAARVVDAVVGLVRPGHGAGPTVVPGPDPSTDAGQGAPGTSGPARGAAERGRPDEVEQGTGQGTDQGTEQGTEQGTDQGGPQDGGDQGSERSTTQGEPDPTAPHPSGPASSPGADVPADPGRGAVPETPADPGGGAQAPGSAGTGTPVGAPSSGGSGEGRLNP